MKGYIFNIQKFSLHDGPGLRTTIFFKGCPLRCKWCSNPESQSGKMQISYDEKSCLKCGICEKNCPSGAIKLSDNKLIYLHNSCFGCLNCVNNCPGGALKAEGRLIDTQELVRICMQDKDFYEESGGGVSFSGGECMYQSDFALELAQLLKEKGISLAAETTGCVAEEIFKRLAPKFDLLLFDLKHHDAKKHLEATAVTNELIIKNLRWAQKEGLNILPRVPVIPFFNDSLDDAKALALLLSDIGLKRVQLLPFHQFGERKYELLGREYSFSGIKALHKEDLEQYREVFIQNGIDAFF